jgi:cyclic-di-GMP-binding protein
MWQKHLPSDLGQSAKKVYHAISDCNKVELAPKDRFEILEIFAGSVEHICHALSRHYLNQTSVLTPQQLTIASLAETLQQQMADGYKLVIEHSANTPDSVESLDSTTIAVALHKIIWYLTQIILLSYELYSIPPKGTWKELHLAYQYAEKNLY